MLFMGREIDPVALWEEYVTFPNGMSVDRHDEFLPKVVCPNPAHQTSKAHFQINARQPTVHCFARCGISGTYEHALAIVNGLYKEDGKPDVKAARKIVLRHTRVSLGGESSAPRVGHGDRKEADDKFIQDDEARFNSGGFAYLPKVALEYLEDRGIGAAARGKWRIGFDEDDHRIVIPAFDIDNRFRFLIKRAVGDGWPKYLYTKGAVKTGILFGACSLDREMVRSRGLVLVEGSVDAIIQHQHGNRNTGGILGTGLSKQQVRIITRLAPPRIYCMFDRDEAGIANVISAWEQLPKFSLYVCRYPGEKKDPGELSAEESERIIERALPVSEFFRKARLSPRRDMTKRGGFKRGVSNSQARV